MKRSIYGIVMRMLWAKKLRLILTAVGIAISVGLMVVISSLYISMEKSVEAIIVKNQGDFELLVGYNPFSPRDSKKLLTSEEIEKLKNLDGVVDAGVLISFPDIAMKQDDVETRLKDGINYVGVEPSSLMRKYLGITIDLQPDEVIITEEVARHWGVKQGDTKEFAIGKDIIVHKTVGEIVPDDFLKLTVVLHIDTVRQAYHMGEVANGVYLDIADDISDKVMEERIRSEVDANLDISLRSQQKDVIKQRGMLRFMAIGIGSIILVVSMLFLSSSFKLMLLGRVRELSTFRIIGASKRVVYKMVMLEAALLNLFGVLLGVGIGIVFVHIATQLVDSMMGITMNSVIVNWQSIIFIALLVWVLLTISVMRVALTAVAVAPLVAIRDSEQEKLSKSIAWLSGSLVFIGITIIILTKLFWMDNGNVFLMTLLGGLLTGVGTLLGTGYIIPIVALLGGSLIRKLAIPEAYYAIKQFIALRKQNTFVVMLLASIVTALIVIPTFIDNLKHSMEVAAIQKHITPIVIEHKRDVIPPNKIEQVRQMEGVKAALPITAFHDVLLGDMDYGVADPKWLKQNSIHPERHRGWQLYNTYEYQWLAVAQTDLNMMRQMGLLDVENDEVALGMIIQPNYANSMGLTLGSPVYLQEISSGENETTPGDRLAQYELPVAGITAFSFVANDTSVLVDSGNPQASWIGNNANNPSQAISAKYIYVQVSEEAEIASVRQALQQLFANDTVIRITDLESELLNIAKEIKEQRVILWTVMTILILIGIIGVINTLGATFHIHRREYAILRAVRLTATKLRSVIIVQGMLYAVTAIIIGIIASVWMITGILIGEDGTSRWSIDIFTVLLPIIIIGIISFVISFIYAQQLKSRSITDELTIEQ